MNSLAENWLAVELNSIDSEINGWSDGLKASFNSLFDEADAAAEYEPDSLIGSASSEAACAA